MLAATRRTRMVDLVQGRESARTDELAAELDVSVETVRRDLEALERQGALHRVHGGAVRAPGTPSVEAPFESRTTIAAGSKRLIGQAAARLVGAAGTVFIDLGTTAGELARAIDPNLQATIVTTSLRVAEMLAGRNCATVLVPGGRVRSGDLSLSGPTATAFLRDIYPDIAFIGSGGLTIPEGLTDYELSEIEHKRLMIAHSRQVFVLADSTKFGVVAPYRVCDLTDGLSVITDNDLPEADKQRLSDTGINLVVA